MLAAADEGEGRMRSDGEAKKFSYSRIALYGKCPLAYQYKYVLGKEELFSTVEQHLGK